MNASKLRRDLKNVPHSCTDWDDAISHIEAARDINGDLRDIAYNAIEALDFLESNYADLEDTVKGLEERIEELKVKLALAEDEIREIA